MKKTKYIVMLHMYEKKNFSCQLPKAIDFDVIEGDH